MRKISSLSLFMSCSLICSVGSGEGEEWEQSDVIPILDKAPLTESKSWMKKVENLGRSVSTCLGLTSEELYGPLMTESAAEDANMERIALRALQTWPHNDMNTEKPQPIIWEAFLEYILEADSPPPLHAAVRNCDDKSVRRILYEDDQGSIINSLDGFKQTAMHYLFAKKQTKCPEVKRVLLAIGLMRAGINSHLGDRKERTVLHLASMKYIVGGGGPANTAIVELILKRPGLHINALDYKNRSALHYAMFNDRTDIAAMLLEIPGIDVFIRDESRKKPIHYALCERKEALITAAQEKFDTQRDETREEND